MHSCTGFTPFKVVTGQDFVSIPELSQTTPLNATLTEWVVQLQNTWPIVLEKVQESYKKQDDKRCSKPKEFKIGDKGYLFTKYLQYRQSSKKLGLKYTGPFPVRKIINPVTIQLELPKTLRRIHPVFHCSLLELATTSPLTPGNEATTINHIDTTPVYSWTESWRGNIIYCIYAIYLARTFLG